MLHAQIRKEITEAMKAKDTLRLNTIRSVSTALTNFLVEKKEKPDGSVSDEDVVKVIQKLSKQRLDSIDQFTKGGNLEMAEQEKSELAILKEYLPTMLSKEEIMSIAKGKMKEMGDDIDKGKFIGVLMKDLSGKADGSMVSEVVQELLNN